MDNGGVSFVPTFDYYWNQNKFRPNVSFGMGYYLVANEIDVSRTFITDHSEDVFIVRVNNQIGFLFRGGMVINRLRLGLE